MDRIHLTQDKDLQRVLVNTLINLRVTFRAGNLTS
jgi:hypothetical protein